MLFTRSFTFTLFLSFIFCSLVGAKDTSNPFIYNLTKFLPSIVWNDDSPVSQTTSLLAGLARDRIPDGYKKDYKDIITVAHVTKLPSLIGGAWDFFNLWIADINNATHSGYRLNKEVESFNVPIYGEPQSIADICIQNGAMYYFGAYLVKYIWKLIVMILSLTRYNMDHLG